MTKVIKNFDELVGLETEKYKIIGCSQYDGHYVNARIKPKDKSESGHYLSTHAFYETQYQFTQRLLRDHGFDVVLESWG